MPSVAHHVPGEVFAHGVVVGFVGIEPIIISQCFHGIVYEIESIEMEVLDEVCPACDTEFYCANCSYVFNDDELEEIANANVPIAEQLMMETDIDIFENFWAKDEAQQKKENNHE